MDLQLLRTFLEVAATGSFGAASGRLFVTQSAVSLRIQRLEDELGHPLFDRTKGGVALTSAGREFRGFATLILRNWEEARQRVGALNGMQPMLTVAAQSSLWPGFGFDWLDRLRAALPDVAIRADTAQPDHLTEMVLSGAAQVVLTYEAMARPGLAVEPVITDQLILVSPWPDATADDLLGRYVLVDWGPDFQRAHDAALPMLSDRKLTLGTGALAAAYLHERALSAYLPARYAASHLTVGTLHLVRHTPRFQRPAFAIWRDDMDPALRAVAGRTLAEVVKQADEATAAALELS